MASLHKSALIYLFANIVVASVPFLLLPILTRYLGPQEYGVVAMFITLLPFLGAFVGLSVHGAISRRWYDRERVDISQYVAGCMSILMVSSILGAAIFWVLADWIAKKLSIPVFWLYGAILVSVFSFLIQIRLVLWQVSERPVLYALFQVGSALVNGAVSLLLVMVYLQGADGRLWGYSLSVLLFGSLSVAWLYRDGLLKFKTQWIHVRDALIFGVPLIPHAVGGVLLVMADRVIVNERLGTDFAGIYMVAVQIALGLEILNAAANKAFVPWVFPRLKAGIYSEKQQIVKATYLYFALLLLLTFVVYVISEHLVLALAGERYAAAAEILPWLVLAQAFNGMYYLVTNYLFYEMKTHITAMITIVCGSLGVLMTWWLVSLYGLKGAAIGAAVAMFLQFICTWIMAARVHPMPWFGVMLVKND